MMGRNVDCWRINCAFIVSVLSKWFCDENKLRAGHAECDDAYVLFSSPQKHIAWTYMDSMEFDSQKEGRWLFDVGLRASALRGLNYKDLRDRVQFANADHSICDLCDWMSAMCVWIDNESFDRAKYIKTGSVSWWSMIDCRCQQWSGPNWRLLPEKVFLLFTSFCIDLAGRMSNVGKFGRCRPIHIPSWMTLPCRHANQRTIPWDTKDVLPFQSFDFH